MKNYLSALVVTLVSVTTGSVTALADLPPDYEQLTAHEKFHHLYSEISTTMELPEFDDPAFYEAPLLLLKRFLAVAFTHVGDELPDLHPKLIHRRGSTAAVEFTPRAGHPYTGMFSRPSKGYARISIAQAKAEAFTPGMGLKLLIDGRESVNFQVMAGLDPQVFDTGQIDPNVFRHGFSNIIARPQGASGATALLLRAFDSTVEHLNEKFGARIPSSTHLPLYEPASVHPDGTYVPASRIVEPYQVIFQPTLVATAFMDAAHLRDANLAHNFREHLRAMRVGTPIYEVYAQEAAAGSTPVHLGTITTRSPFFSSRYQDEKLYFRHSMGN